MKKLVLAIAVLFSLNAAEAQRSCFITKGSAFYRIVMPGNIPVGPDGKPREMPVNEERFIYLLSSCKIKPAITSIMYGTNGVSAVVNEETEKTVTVGNDPSGKQILLHAPKGYFFRRLDITGTDSLPAESRPAKIWIRGTIANKKFSLYISKESRAEGMPAY